jgi:hypothetical protein
MLAKTVPLCSCTCQEGPRPREASTERGNIDPNIAVLDAPLFAVAVLLGGSDVFFGSVQRMQWKAFFNAL